MNCGLATGLVLRGFLEEHMYGPCGVDVCHEQRRKRGHEGGSGVEPSKVGDAGG
jgi:hypothetical protein